MKVPETFDEEMHTRANQISLFSLDEIGWRKRLKLII